MRKFEIKTGYFQKIKKYEQDGFVCISISKYPPSWYYGFKNYALAPNKLNYPSKEDYINDFNSKLKKLNPKEVVETIKKVSNFNPVVLLCYEKPDEFCHRHLVADWLNKAIPDLNVIEHGELKQTAPKNYGKQTSLF